MHPGGFSAEDTQDVQYTNQNIIINNNTSTNHNNIFIQNPLLTKKEIPKIEYMKPEAIECYHTILENFSDTALAPKARTALESLGVTVATPTTTEEDSSEDEGI